MRRKDREIRELDDIINVMRKCDVCRIALHGGEYPYILPLNFGVEVVEKKIFLYFHGATEGRKIELIRRNNKAGFEMDCSHKIIIDEKACNSSMEYESVIGGGTIDFIDGADEKYHALRILMEHYANPTENNFVFSEQMVSKTAVFKLTVSEITGKRRILNV